MASAPPAHGPRPVSLPLLLHRTSRLPDGHCGSGTNQRRPRGVLADTTRGQLLEEVEERDLFLRSLDDDRDCSVITICSPSFSAADSSAPAAISTRTTEIDEDSQIRLLVTAHAYDHACARVEAVVRALETARRPRALLEARILHARCLAAAGRAVDAKRVLIPVTADCAEYGLPRLVADGGEPVTGLLTEIADDQRRGRGSPNGRPSRRRSLA